MKIYQSIPVKQRFTSLLMVLLFLSMSACSDKWDEHYDSNKMTLGNSLMATLEKDSTLTIFVKMVQIAKLESRITNSESFTIWAPNNTALSAYVYLLNSSGLSSEDSVSIASVVKNHIGRYFVSTSEITDLGSKVGMINGKYILFKKSGSNFTFGGKSLVASKSNQVCSNGVLHVIQGVIPFEKNIWETIKLNAEYSSIYNFINAFDSTYMDEKLSIKIGINANGQSVYDSVFVFTNTLLRKIGAVNQEDSTYTCILPTNTAYNAAYNAYKGYYKSNGGISAKLSADSVTKANTNYAIIKDLFFRGAVDTQSSDSLVSTTGSVFHDRASIFGGATDIPVSNGIAYKTDQLNFNLFESLLKPITLEMEDLRYGASLDYDALVQYANYKIFPYANLVSGVSGGYLLIDPSSLSTKPYLETTLTGALSGSYDIYCTTVPNNAEDTTGIADPTILDFSLGYYEGKSWKIKSISSGKITNATNVDEFLVASNVSIPFIDAKVSLLIEVNVPSSKVSLYSRQVRIDKIRLVPRLQ